MQRLEKNRSQGGIDLQKFVIKLRKKIPGKVTGKGKNQKKSRDRYKVFRDTERILPDERAARAIAERLVLKHEAHDYTLWSEGKRLK